MKNPRIRYLFEPRSIAVVGASHDEHKIGYKVLANILSGGYKGKIYPINPHGGRILGLKAYKSISEVGGEVDMACIVIPAKYVFDAIRECADKGVKFAPIITSGFSEIGNIEEEKRIVEYARRKGMRILGPNIFGVYSSASSMNATFGPDRIQAGGVAIITQSGALGLSMIGKTAVENIGLSDIISVGNKADIDESELLDHLVKEKDTKLILMYIEGVRDGGRLVKALKKATKKKPVIVIKSGRSKRGAMAVASHTGSLAGEDDIFDDIMRQCGVLRAESIEEAFNWCKFLANTPISSCARTVVITNGGGIGVMAADASEKYGVSLYDDSQILKKVFSAVTPNFGSTKNPVDLTGGATSRHYNDALDAALRSGEVDAVIALYCETAVFDAENLTSTIADNYEKFRSKGKPLVFSVFGGESIESSIIELRKKAVPVFDSVYDAVSCLGAMQWYYDYVRTHTHDVEDAEIDSEAIEAVARRAQKEGRSFLLAHEGQEIMGIAGVPIPKSRIAHSIEKAVDYAEGIGYPVVMKIVSRDILHKSDVGGVVLDLQSRKEVMDAYEVMMRRCKSHYPNADIKGVEVAEMVRAGTEIIVGARRDAKFGPIVMCGLGGIYVEVMKDISFRAAPLNRREVMSMIKEIRSYPILLGVRGEDKKDIDALVDTVIKVGTIVHKCPSISDIEINPVAVYEDGVMAVDIRVLLSKSEEENG